jgi:hypothetical protein
VQVKFNTLIGEGFNVLLPLIGQPDQKKSKKEASEFSDTIRTNGFDRHVDGISVTLYCCTIHIILSSP